MENSPFPWSLFDPFQIAARSQNITERYKVVLDAQTKMVDATAVYNKALFDFYAAFAEEAKKSTTKETNEPSNR